MNAVHFVFFGEIYSALIGVGIYSSGATIRRQWATGASIAIQNEQACCMYLYNTPNP